LIKITANLNLSGLMMNLSTEIFWARL